jgi:tRNA(Ile)-lysidine synthase
MASSRKRRSGSARIAVGLSGGVDSVVLLHMLKERAAAQRFSLDAIHVNHGLSPPGAWARSAGAVQAPSRAADRQKGKRGEARQG